MSQQLRAAAAKGDLAKVRAHLAKDVHVNAPHNYSGRTALIEAVFGGHLDVARLLLESGADINWRDAGTGFTPLGWAANEANLPLVRRLFIEHGANLELGNESGLTPMMVAAGGGHLLVVQALLYAGANVNTPANDGRTALSFARARKHTEVVAVLLDSGGEETPLAEPVAIPWPVVDETGSDL